MRNALTRRAGFAGLAVASIVVLAGCGTGGSTAAGPTALTELGDPEGAVSILAWPGYVEDGTNDPAYDWVSDFETETGCMVTAKTYGSSDEAVSRTTRWVEFLTVSPTAMAQTSCSTTPRLSHPLPPRGVRSSTPTALTQARSRPMTRPSTSRTPRCT